MEFACERGAHWELEMKHDIGTLRNLTWIIRLTPFSVRL